MNNRSRSATTREDAFRSRYPLAYAAGFEGSKSEMRAQVNLHIRDELAAASPAPPRSKWFKSHHLGHAVTQPILRTSELDKAGSWIQFCKNRFSSVECRRPKVLKPPLGIDHALQPPFVTLYAVRDELAPVPLGRRPRRMLADLPPPVHAGTSSRTIGVSSSLSSINSEHLSLPSSPSMPPTSSPPSSPVSSVIDLTMEESEDECRSSPLSSAVDLSTTQSERENEPAKVLVKFWLRDFGKSPKTVWLQCERGAVCLDTHKVLLGEHRVEKCVMEAYSRGRKRWEGITWAGNIQVDGSSDLLIREKGMKVEIAQ
ncbi:hypothetical protein V5O48_009655 [Marasmius crinis-equi]|uniref:Uncharacterized protein n=1 Tax=Marasmius crinis-equi TaxID=585013 RepID=A0ABR3FAK7_9AGAR